MSLGMKVGLVPGVFVLDGDTDPPDQKRSRAANFRPTFVVPNWMKLVLGMEVGQR